MSAAVAVLTPVEGFAAENPVDPMLPECVVDGTDGVVTLTWTVSDGVKVNLRGEGGWIATYTGPGTHAVAGQVDAAYFVRTRSTDVVTDTLCRPDAAAPDVAVSCVVSARLSQPGTDLSWTVPGQLSVNIRVDGDWLETREGSGSAYFEDEQPGSDWLIRTRQNSLMVSTPCEDPDDGGNDDNNHLPPPTECTINGVIVDTVLPPEQCDALVAIYNATNGPGWSGSDAWNTATDPCDWFGVSCDGVGITDLILEANRLSGSFPPEIARLTDLTTLDLASNDLTSVPAELGDLTNLTRLNLRGNDLTSVPTELGNLSNLTWLSLSYNDLTSVPAKLGNLSSLENLGLSNNRLSSIPDEFGNLTSLKGLGLSRNNLSSLPATVGNLTNLTNLSVGENDLTSLPASIGNLGSLQHLRLLDNRLTSLPSEIGQLTELTILYLARNELTSLPDEFANMTNLWTLTLYSNRLTSLPPEFGNLDRLEFLNIRDNRLTLLPDNFGNLSSLISVNLKDNLLRALPAGFGGLKKARIIDLGNNQLTGDITEAMRGMTADLLILWDGPGGNDCLTVTDPLVRDWLNMETFRWDECDAP